MRVCDYIAKRLYEYGVRHIFGIPGGGAAGLNDGFVKHGGFKWICNHHEQGAAFAAMGMAKLSGKLAVVNPTTGCGGTNCITGVLDAWQDSTPVLFISGNVNKAQMTRYYKDEGLPKARQHGVQEADIVEIVRSITKYARTVDTPNQIVSKLDNAIREATTGRQGPVWLDVPTDIQTAEMLPDLDTVYIGPGHLPEVSNEIRDKVWNLLERAERPLYLLGAGARGSDLEALLQHQMFVVTYGAIDIYSDDPKRVGVVGTKGDRAGNMALYNCDLLIVLGSSFNTSVTGYNLSHFAPHALVIIVDIAPSPTHALGDHVTLVQSTIDDFSSWASARRRGGSEWVRKCQGWREKWPVCLPEYCDDKDGINLYWFINELSKILPPHAAVVSDAGSAFYVTCQGLKLKEGQRHIQSLGQADMGWAIPASIGVALEGVPTIVITGDGSFQTNIQELATIKAHNLPVKVIVWNNDGYLSNRNTQKKLFEGRLLATDSSNGLWFPALTKIAEAYEMDYYKLRWTKELDHLNAILAAPGPAIIEVITPFNQAVGPSIGARRGEDGQIKAEPLWNMAPFIPGIEKELIV